MTKQFQGWQLTMAKQFQALYCTCNPETDGLAKEQPLKELDKLHTIPESDYQHRCLIHDASSYLAFSSSALFSCDFETSSSVGLGQYHALPPYCCYSKRHPCPLAMVVFVEKMKDALIIVHAAALED